MVASADDHFNPSREAVSVLAVSRVLSEDASNLQGTIGAETGRGGIESREASGLKHQRKWTICMIDTARMTWP